MPRSKSRSTTGAPTRACGAAHARVNGGVVPPRAQLGRHACVSGSARLYRCRRRIPARCVARRKRIFCRVVRRRRPCGLDVEFAGFPQAIVAHPEFLRKNTPQILSNTVPSSLVIRRAVYRALGGFPTDEFFRRVGGEDGAFSWALSKLFGNRRLIDAKRVRQHYHPAIHAERFFRIHMGMEQPSRPRGGRSKHCGCRSSLLPEPRPRSRNCARCTRPPARQRTPHLHPLANARSRHSRAGCLSACSCSGSAANVPASIRPRECPDCRPAAWC